ncbi:MAG: hypothetical protein WAT25_10440 [Paracoccaceae bacterium]|nr:hypothetical protein [Rhodobacter sp.]
MHRPAVQQRRKHPRSCWRPWLCPPPPGPSRHGCGQGGRYHDALREASVQPAAEQPRITIGKDTLSTGLADVRLQLTGDAVRWDLADLSAKECVAGAKEGLLEPIDYGIVNAEGIDPRLVRDDRVGFLYGS